MYLEQFCDFWHYAQNGRNLGIFCVGAAQLDMYGNANNSVIGDDYHAPEGAAPRHGGARRHGLARQAPLLLEHEPQPAVARRAGGLPLGGRLPRRRRRAGAARADGPGPEVVVTNLAVLDFEPESKRMRLVSVHPGVTVEQVQEATGFELLLPDGDVPETTPPTAEQVRLLREDIDPDGMCKREAGVKVDGDRIRSARDDHAARRQGGRVRAPRGGGRLRVDLVAEPPDGLAPGVGVDGGHHAAREVPGQPAHVLRPARDDGRRRGRHREDPRRRGRDRRDHAPPGRARADRADARPRDEGPRDPRPRQRRAAQRRPLRDGVVEAGRPPRRGARRDPPPVERRRRGRLRRAVLPPQGRRARALAVHAGRAADLDRRAQAAHARDHRPQGRRVAPDEDVRERVRRGARADPRGLRRTPGAPTTRSRRGCSPT